jgi:hypothetical protein
VTKNLSKKIPMIPTGLSLEKIKKTMVGFTKNEKPAAFRAPIRLYKHASRCIKKFAMVFCFYGLRDPEFVLGLDTYNGWKQLLKHLGFFTMVHT